jgi:glycosyltransferase involved in cell wall biosynthesis
MTTVLSVIPTLGLGGAEAIAADIAVGLGGYADLRSHLHVVADIRGDRGRAIMHKLEDAGVSVTVGDVRTPKSWEALGKLRRVVDIIRPSVLLAHLPSAEILASILRVSPRTRRLSLVRIFHTPKIGFKQRIVSSIYQRSVACSYEVAQHAFDAGVPRVTTILNGIDLAEFPQPVNSVHSPNCPFDIAMVARGGLHGPKGLDLAIEAVGNLGRTKPVRLHLFGVASEEMPEILAYAKKHRAENAICVHGVVPNLAKSIQVLQPAVALMPSRYEGLSVALMEFSALGIPLVLSNIPSFRNAYRAGFDWRFFEAGDAGCLARVLEAPTEPRGAGYASLAREAFGNVSMVGAYANLVRSITEEEK